LIYSTHNGDDAPQNNLRCFAMNRSDNKGNSLQVNKTIIAKKANFIIQ